MFPELKAFYDSLPDEDRLPWGFDRRETITLPLSVSGELLPASAVQEKRRCIALKESQNSFHVKTKTLFLNEKKADTYRDYVEDMFAWASGRDTDPQCSSLLKAVLRFIDSDGYVEMREMLALLSDSENADLVPAALDAYARENNGSSLLESMLNRDGELMDRWIVFALQTDYEDFEIPNQEVADFAIANAIAKDQPTIATCLCCGQKEASIMKTAKFQIGGTFGTANLVAANDLSYESWGHSKSENSPTCMNCSNSIIQALRYMDKNDRNHAHQIFDKDGVRKTYHLDSSNPLFYWSPGGAEEVFDLIAETIDPAEHVSAIHDQVVQKRSLSGGENPERLIEPVFLATITTDASQSVVRTKDFWTIYPEQLYENVEKWKERQRLLLGTSRFFRIPEMWFYLKPNEGGGKDALAFQKRTMLELQKSALLGRPVPVDILSNVMKIVRSNILGMQKIGEYGYQSVMNDQHRVLLGVSLIENPMSSLHNVKTPEDLQNAKDASVGYRCGRLLRVIADIQKIGGSNEHGGSVPRAVKAFSVASTRPLIVFPKLIENVEYYLQKPSIPGWCEPTLRNAINDVMNATNSIRFPTHLTNVQQAEFMMGFFDKAKKEDVPSTTQPQPEEIPDEPVA